MALTKLNALGAAIRAKVGETEKKTLPELTAIVEDELIKPTGIKEIEVFESEVTEDIAEYKNISVSVPMFEELDEYFQTVSGLHGYDGYWQTFCRIHERPPYINSINCTTFGSLLFQVKKMKILKINVSSAKYLNEAFDQCGLTHLTLVGSTQNVTNMNYMFFMSKLLEIVDGEPIDFSSCTTANFFAASECDALREIRFVANTLSVNLPIQGAPSLSKQSVLSVINCLKSDVTGKTINFHSTVKNHMANDWKCKLNTETLLYEDSDDADAISYSSAVTNGKGWTLG